MLKTHFFCAPNTWQSIVCTPESSAILQLLVVLGATLLLAFSAQLSIPLVPVPLTFQSVTVVFIGMILGARLGAYTVLTYWIAGCMGCPVFANFSAGFAVFLGPTGGYLIGFLPAAALGGFLASTGFIRSIGLSFISAVLSALIIFLFGFLVLSHFVGVEKAWALGVKPFIFTETLKLILLAWAAPRFWKNA